VFVFCSTLWLHDRVAGSQYLGYAVSTVGFLLFNYARSRAAAGLAAGAAGKGVV
jgi:hypothetical protein